MSTQKLCFVSPVPDLTLTGPWVPFMWGLFKHFVNGGSFQMLLKSTKKAGDYDASKQFQSKDKRKHCTNAYLGKETFHDEEENAECLLRKGFSLLRILNDSYKTDNVPNLYEKTNSSDISVIGAPKKNIHLRPTWPSKKCNVLEKIRRNKNIVDSSSHIHTEFSSYDSLSTSTEDNRDHLFGGCTRSNYKVPSVQIINDSFERDLSNNSRNRNGFFKKLFQKRPKGDTAFSNVSRGKRSPIESNYFSKSEVNIILNDVSTSLFKNVSSNSDSQKSSNSSRLHKQILNPRRSHKKESHQPNRQSFKNRSVSKEAAANMLLKSMHPKSAKDYSTTIQKQKFNCTILEKSVSVLEIFYQFLGNSCSSSSLELTVTADPEGAVKKTTLDQSVITSSSNEKCQNFFSVNGTKKSPLKKIAKKFVYNSFSKRKREFYSKCKNKRNVGKLNPLKTIAEKFSSTYWCRKKQNCENAVQFIVETRRMGTANNIFGRPKRAKCRAEHKEILNTSSLSSYESLISLCQGYDEFNFANEASSKYSKSDVYTPLSDRSVLLREEFYDESSDLVLPEDLSDMSRSSRTDSRSESDLPYYIEPYHSDDGSSSVSGKEMIQRNFKQSSSIVDQPISGTFANKFSVKSSPGRPKHILTFSFNSDNSVDSNSLLDRQQSHYPSQFVTPTLQNPASSKSSLTVQQPYYGLSFLKNPSYQNSVEEISSKPILLEPKIVVYGVESTCEDRKQKFKQFSKLPIKHEFITKEHDNTFSSSSIEVNAYGNSNDNCVVRRPTHNKLRSSFSGNRIEQTSVPPAQVLSSYSSSLQYCGIPVNSVSRNNVSCRTQTLYKSEGKKKDFVNSSVQRNSDPITKHPSNKKKDSLKECKKILRAKSILKVSTPQRSNTKPWNRFNKSFEKSPNVNCNRNGSNRRLTRQDSEVAGVALPPYSIFRKSANPSKFKQNVPQPKCSVKVRGKKSDSCSASKSSSSLFVPTRTRKKLRSGCSNSFNRKRISSSCSYLEGSTIPLRTNQNYKRCEEKPKFNFQKKNSKYYHTDSPLSRSISSTSTDKLSNFLKYRKVKRVNVDQEPKFTKRNKYSYVGEQELKFSKRRSTENVATITNKYSLCDKGTSYQNVQLEVGSAFVKQSTPRCTSSKNCTRKKSLCKPTLHKTTTATQKSSKLFCPKKSSICSSKRKFSFGRKKSICTNANLETPVASTVNASTSISPKIGDSQSGSSCLKNVTIKSNLPKLHPCTCGTQKTPISSNRVSSSSLYEKILRNLSYCGQDKPCSKLLLPSAPKPEVGTTTSSIRTTPSIFINCNADACIQKNANSDKELTKLGATNAGTQISESPASKAINEMSVNTEPLTTKSDTKSNKTDRNVVFEKTIKPLNLVITILSEPDGTNRQLVVEGERKSNNSVDIPKFDSSDKYTRQKKKEKCTNTTCYYRNQGVLEEKSAESLKKYPKKKEKCTKATCYYRNQGILAEESAETLKKYPTQNEKENCTNTTCSYRNQRALAEESAETLKKYPRQNECTNATCQYRNQGVVEESAEKSKEVNATFQKEKDTKLLEEFEDGDCLKLLRAILAVSNKESKLTTMGSRSSFELCSTCCSNKKDNKANKMDRVIDEYFKLCNTFRDRQKSQFRDYRNLENRIKCLDSALKNTVLQPYLDYLLEQEPTKYVKQKNVCQMCGRRKRTKYVYRCEHENPLVDALAKYLKRNQVFDNTLNKYLKRLKHTSCSYEGLISKRD